MSVKELDKYINAEITKRFGSITSSFKSKIFYSIIYQIYIMQCYKNFDDYKFSVKLDLKLDDLLEEGINPVVIQMMTIDLLDTLEMYYVARNPEELTINEVRFMSD